MSLETRLRAAIVMSLLSLVILTFFYFQQKDELQKCKSDNGFLQGGDIEKSQILNQRDSLHDELFNERVDAGRHELTREAILNKYPELKKEYEEYFNHQTE
jgi:hypothetical protein